MFYEYKLKDSNEIVYIDNPDLDHGSLCYKLMGNKNFELLKDNQFVLDNEWVIKTDHEGKIYEQWNNLKYYSQLGQDTFVDRFLSQKENGFFVEIGAFDGVEGSNSLFFERERNWSGICIEPIKEEFDKLVENRKSLNLNVAVYNFDGETKFTTVEGYAKMLSGISDTQSDSHKWRINHEIEINGGSVNEFDINVRTLQSIFDEFNISEVDYCSVDTEGSELEIIKSIDFNKTKIKIFSVENNYQDDKVKKYLDQHGYQLYKKIMWDDIFISVEFLNSIEKNKIENKIQDTDNDNINQLTEKKEDILYTQGEVLEIFADLFAELENRLQSIKTKKIEDNSSVSKKVKRSKILFTLISIDTGQKFYLEAAKRLSEEILNQTKHDILISTNDVDFFSDINSDRCTIRDNIKKDSVFKYGSEFNYNLKHHAFIDIPKEYEYVIYLDCDIKLNSWRDESDFFMETQMINYDFGADRLNCYLKDEVSYFLSGLNCLFKHKINSYDILDRYSMDDDIMNSRLPSEHFLILKNDSEKIKKFQEKWEEQNYYLQNKEGVGGSWGDGFEIGISARYAGFENIMEMNPYYWSEILGFKFNGNKY